jgi:hypothetical protein
MKRNRRLLSRVVAAAIVSAVLPAGARADELHRYDIDTASPTDHIDVAYGRVPTPGSNLLHRWVVAGRDANSNLRIRGYAFTSSSRENITNDWATSAGTVTQVAVAWVGASGYSDEDDRFVTAVRDSEGKLRLISWAYGEAERLDTGDYQPSILNSQISIATLFNGYVATAAREADEDIRLDLWRITNSGSVIHEASAIAGRGSFANVVVARTGKLVAVFRNQEGQLSTQMFSIDAQYSQLTWHSGWVSSQAGKVKARPWNENYIVAAFETSSDTLGVYFYDTQDDIKWHAGNIQSGHATGAIADLSVNTTGKLTTAVTLPSGTLKIIRWNFVSGGVERDTDNVESGYPEGAASYPAVEGGSGAGNDISTYDQLLTAVREADGDLRLTVWHSD